MKHAGYGRWFRAFVALVFLASTAIPAFVWMDGMKAYALSPEVEKVIGDANKNLSAKFSFDQQGNKWQFNKNGAAALAANIAKQQGTNDVDGVAGALSQLTAQQVGGGGKKDTSLYSVDLPVKAREGITYYDNVNKLSFKMVPDFGARDGKLVQDRIVYPFGDGAQVVYTAKSNGMKEDIVLNNYTADTLRYSYNLELPETLAAKLLEDGSIGIYSASPALFGNISFSNESDKARVMEARKTGTKDHLVFSIPAPFIKDQTGNAGHTKYLLNGNRVTVVADQLGNLKYPLTVDPSVLVSSTSHFGESNNEGNSEIGTDQINRSGLTGATISAWGTQTAVPASGSGSCGGYAQAYGVYNGYLYAVCNNTTAYARLNTNGTINGTWQTGTVPPSNTAGRAGFIYNGYMYITGGADLGSNGIANTYYAKLNSNGTMGSWIPGTNLGTARHSHQATAYNGYAYVTAGNTALASYTGSIEKAAINANGSLGAWSSVGNSTLSPTRGEHIMRIYNGFMYATNGTPTSGNRETVQFAPVNSDGTIGAWIATTVIPGSGVNATYRSSSVIHNGYWYMVGGCDGSCSTGAGSGQRKVMAAPVYASGHVGDWQQLTTLAVDSANGQFGVYNNYLFIATSANNVYSAAIDTPGVITGFTTETDEIVAGEGRSGAATVAYNGYLYVIGGYYYSGGLVTNNDTVFKAQVNSDGSTGAWTPTTSFTTARGALAAVAYDGYMYIIGGWKTGTATSACHNSGSASSACSDVQRAQINLTDGTLGTWTLAGTGTTSSYISAGPRWHLGAFAYNGYLYAVAGDNEINNANGSLSYAPIGAGGVLGIWQTSATPVSGSGEDGHSRFGIAVNNNKVYLVGGRTNSPGTFFTTGVLVGTIDPGGDITSWTSTSSITTARNGAQATVYNGYIYMSGGTNNSGPSGDFNDIQYARINSGGTLESWQTLQSTFTTNRGYHGMVAYNGFLYILGGCGNWNIATGANTCTQAANFYRDVQYARINNGGNGATGSWAEGATAPGGLYEKHAAGGYATYGGYIYALKGCTASTDSELICAGTGMSSDMHFAKVNADGTHGSWSTLSTVGTPPTDRVGLAAVAYNGYLYAVGGCTATSNTGGGYRCTTFSKDIHMAQINSSTGNVGTWTSTTGFDASVGRYGHTAVAYNGYMYVAGGCTATATGACTTFEDTVRVAAIDNSNGTIGAWSSAGSAFTTGRLYHQSVAYNGYLYIVSGCTAMTQTRCTTFASDVRSIALNSSNGSFSGSWQNVNMLDVARTNFGAVAYNGYIYIAGGCTSFSAATDQCNAYVNNVKRAPLLSNGTVGRWEKIPTDMAEGTMSQGLVVASGYLVTMFGVSATHSYYTKVRTSPINVQARIGKYSKIVSTDPTTDISGVYYNGTLPYGSSVTYRVAPSSGVFGSTSPAALGSGSEPTPLCGMGTIYYVQLMAVIDDSTTGIYPDVDSVQGNVTDMTVYYRLNATPKPNERMVGGKWFWNETQRPLDTCKQPNAS